MTTAARIGNLWQRMLVVAERRLPALTRLRQSEPLPVVLSRRRIYVLPTRFGIAFALMLFTMMLGALNYNNNAAVLLTCLLAGATFLSMFGGFRTLDGLALQAVHAPPCFAGDRLALQLQFSSGTRLRRALRLDHPGGSRLFRLAPEDSRLQLDLPTQRRGWYDLPRLRLWTEFPLGQFWVWSYLHPEFRCVIYPRPEAQGPALPDSARVGGGMPQRREGEDFATLRSYRASDPPRLIAWKASARHDTLLVREHEHNPTREVVLDFSAVDSPDREARIARLARWVLLAESERRPYELRLPHRRIGPALGPEHRHTCLTELALL